MPNKVKPPLRRRGGQIAPPPPDLMCSVFWLYLASLLTAENYGEIQFYVSLAGMAFALSMLGTRNTIIIYEAKKIGLRKILFLGLECY